MDFKRFLDNKYSKYIISILLGLGLASLFRRACNEKKCLRFVGPPIDEIKKNKYSFDKKCYQYKQYAKSCNKNNKQVSFA